MNILGKNGVLQLARRIRQELNNNTLGLAEVYQVMPGPGEASQMFGDERDMVQKKTITIRYKRQVSLKI